MSKSIYYFSLSLIVAALAAAQPQIKLSPTSVDLGDISSTTTPKITVKVENTGTEPLIIKSVEAGCSCLTAYYPTHPVPTHTVDSIIIFINADKLNGKFARLAVVATNIVGSADQFVEIRGNVIRAVPSTPQEFAVAAASDEVRQHEEIVTSTNSRILRKTLPTADRDQKAILTQRKKSMLELARKDPHRFLQLSIAENDLSAISPENRSLIESKQSVTGTLTIIVHDGFGESPTYTDYVVQDNTGKMHTVFFDGLIPRLKTNQTISIKGVGIDNAVVTDRNNLKVEARSAGLDTTQRTTGVQNVAVFLIDFLDSYFPWPADFTNAWVKDQIENGQFAKFMYEQSYGKILWKADVYGHFTINGTYHGRYNGVRFVGPDASLDEIKYFTDSLGIAMTKYNRILIIENHQYVTGAVSYVGMSNNIVGNQTWFTSVSWIGNANIGGNSTFKNPSGWGAQPFSWTNFDYLVSHEMGGHGLGANHAGIMRCEPGVIFYGRSCNENNPNDRSASYNYGNYYDVMGTTSFTLHTNAYYKDLFNWIDHSSMKVISQPGIYTINALESPNGVQAAKIFCKGVDTTAEAYMYIEIRRPIGFDKKMNYAGSGWPNTTDNLNGIFVNVINQYSSSDKNFARTFLLDMTPGSIGGTTESYYDAMNVTLNVGKTYTDAPKGISITTLAVDSVSATFQVAYSEKPTCWDMKPILLDGAGVPDYTSSPGMSMHRPVENIYNFGYRFIANPNIDCKTSLISLKPNFPSEWGVEQYRVLSSGEYIPVIDSTFAVATNDTVDIVTYDHIPRVWLAGQTYSFKPTVRFTLHEYSIIRDSVSMIPFNISFGNNSCITRKPLFIGKTKYQISRYHQFILPVILKNNSANACSDGDVYTYALKLPQGWTAKPYHCLYQLSNVPDPDSAGFFSSIQISQLGLRQFYNKYIRKGYRESDSIYYMVTVPEVKIGVDTLINTFTNVNLGARADTNIVIEYVDPCVRNTPTLVAEPPNVEPWIPMTLKITNNDNSYCTSSSFNITTTYPFPYDLTVDSIITPGVKKSFTFLARTAPADWTFSITAKNIQSGLSATVYRSVIIPKLEVRADTVRFGNTVPNTIQPAKVRLVNSGKGRLRADSVWIEGAGFMVPDTVKKFVVLGLDSLEIPVMFTPDSHGAYKGHLSIRDTCVGILKKVELTGISTPPQIVINGTTQNPQDGSPMVSFGLAMIGRSITKPLRVTNVSASRLVIDSLWTRTARFSVTGPSRVDSISAGDTMTVQVTFMPDSSRSYTDTLTILSNSVNKLARIPLTGSSPYPILVLSQPNLAFGLISKDSMRQKTFSITDSSINTLRIDSLWTKTKYFSVAKTLQNPIIKQGDTARVIVSFRPDSLRTYLDTLFIVNNSFVSLKKMPLSGSGVTGANQFGDQIPREFALFQNYPNPFNPSTTLRYALPADSRVKLHIYNVLGQQVSDLVNADQPAGYYQVSWNANVASGMYIYRLEAVSTSDPNKRFVDVKKMILMR